MAAWAVPVEPAEVAECTAFLITAIEPDLARNPNRVKTMVSLCQMQDYTRAEWLLVMKRMAFENNFNGGFRLDVLDTLIQRSRNVRRIVADPVDGTPRLLTERQMFDACQEYPEAFRSTDFGIATYDPQDRPFYRYSKSGQPQVHRPVPQLPEADPVRRETPTAGAPPPPDFAAMVQAEAEKHRPRSSGDGSAEGDIREAA